MPREIDPGDAVPPGVAPQTPAPLTREDEAVRRKLERIGKRGQPSADPNPAPENRSDQA